jgi:hypothetical protein
LAQRKRHIDVFGSTQKGGREILSVPSQKWYYATWLGW